MRILKTFMFLLLCLPNLSFANQNKENARDEFDATIIMVESINKIWVQLLNKKEYELHSKDVPLRNKRSSYYVMPVYLYGVEFKEISEVKNKEKDKQYQACIRMNRVLKNHESKVKCFYRERREGIWVCSVNVEGVDLGSEVISSGVSSFTIPEGISIPKLDKEYKSLESKAKEQKKGIWEPYYSLSF